MTREGVSLSLKSAWFSKPVSLTHTYQFSSHVNMDLFYCPSLSLSSREVALPPEETHHIKRVFRKRAGEEISLTNGKGTLATGSIDDVKSQQVVCRILTTSQVPAPPEQQIQLVLSTIRPNRMDWAVEKLTELGVGSIQPIYSEFTSIKTFKTAHLQKIAVSAMKQSKQAYLPELHAPISFADWLGGTSFTEDHTLLIAHLSDASVKMNAIEINDDGVILAVGPEGGFSRAEIDAAQGKGFQPVILSGQILRAETAAITAVAQLKLQFQ